MKNKLTVFAATTAILLATAATAAEPSGKTENDFEYKKNGGYEATSTSKTTDSKGTTKASKTKVDVDVDSDNNVTKKVKSEYVADPKGLQNKVKETSESKAKEKDDGGFEKTSKTSKTNAEGTNITSESKTKVDVDNDGNVTETETTKDIKDPKGLMNKTKSTTKVKKVNGQVVESEKKGD